MCLLACLQVTEIGDLQKDLKDAEGQRDMLLELMQSSDHMSVEEVQNLCNRLEESVAASSSELSDRLQGEQAARKKVRDSNTLSKPCILKPKPKKRSGIRTLFLNPTS